MQVQCDSCMASYRIDEAKIQKDRINVRCPKCQGLIRVEKPVPMQTPPLMSNPAPTQTPIRTQNPIQATALNQNIVPSDAQRSDSFQGQRLIKCPFCAEEILPEAVVCKHCGTRLEKAKPEKQLISVHPSMYRSHPIVFILGIILLALFGTGLLILIPWWISCLASTLTVTNKRTILRKGILSKHTNEVLHSHIRNIQVKQGMIQRMFGAGTIEISSAGQSDIEIKFSGLKHPYKVKEMIDQYRSE